MNTAPPAPTDLRASRTLGLDAYMDRHRLDAVLFPGASGAAIAAKAGYPSIQVPAGFVRRDRARPDYPFGATFTGRAWSEPMLLRLAYAFEQATQARRPPPGLPALAIVSRRSNARISSMILPQIVLSSAAAHRNWREIRGKPGPCTKFFAKIARHAFGKGAAFCYAVTVAVSGQLAYNYLQPRNTAPMPVSVAVPVARPGSASTRHSGAAIVAPIPAAPPSAPPLVTAPILPEPLLPVASKPGGAACPLR